MIKRLRISIADDDAFVRRYFEETLTDMGHEVVSVAENGRQLVQQCGEEKPELVISDIKMPEMDGIDAAIEISKQHSVPIILVSAHHDPDMIERVAASRIMGYLVKPIKRADLETAIALAWGRFETIEVLQDEWTRMHEKLKSRQVIEKAKALLMESAGLSSEHEALMQMERRASQTKSKLLDVARLILAAESPRELFENSDG
ncbi:MAG: response regulator [Pirellulales bacterium]